MISEESIKEAVEKAAQVLLDELPDCQQCEHQFSPEFERKMKRLIWKTKHPIFYGAMRSVASVLLVLIVGATVLLTVDVEARANAWKWIHEMRGNISVYYSGDSVDSPDVENGLPGYVLGVEPEGYKVDIIDKSETNGSISYINEEGIYFHFIYLYNTDFNASALMLMGTGGAEAEITPVMVGKYRGDYHHYEDEEIGDAIVWQDDEKSVLFAVSGRFPLSELLKIAENVVEE